MRGTVWAEFGRYCCRVRAVQGVLLAVLYLTVLVGCGTPPKRVYQPNPPDPSVRQLPLRVAVVELEDGTDSETINTGDGFKILVPGVISVPNLVAYHQTMFGACLTKELKGSRLFAAVDYHQNWERLREEYQSYDFIVTGRLLADKVLFTGYSYGLSFASGMLTYVGVPNYSADRDVAFEVVAFAPARPSSILWKDQYTFSDTSWGNIFWYGKMAREGDGNALDDPLSIIQSVSNALPIKHTDLCTTEKLQPLFLGMRKSLSAALRENVLTGRANSQPQ